MGSLEGRARVPYPKKARVEHAVHTDKPYVWCNRPNGRTHVRDPKHPRMTLCGWAWTRSSFAEQDVVTTNQPLCSGKRGCFSNVRISQSSSGLWVEHGMILRGHPNTAEDFSSASSGSSTATGCEGSDASTSGGERAVSSRSAR